MPDHQQHPQHRIGVILVIVSAMVFSSAGIFTKGVETAAWDIIFWRGVFAAGFTLLYLGLRGALRREVRAMTGLPTARPCCWPLAQRPSFRPSS